MYKTATQRILDDFSTFCRMYIEGMPYRDIADYYETSLPTINMTVMPTLRSLKVITSKMEEQRKVNLPKTLAQQSTLKRKERTEKRKKRLQNAIDTIQKSDRRYKILADCCIFDATALAEFDLEKLQLCDLSQNEQRYITDYFRKKYGHYYKYEKLLCKIYHLTDGGIFNEYIGSFYLNGDQRRGIDFVLNKLTDRHQKIIEYRIFRGFTYDKIAQWLGIKSGETIRQQFNAAIRILRHPRWHSYLINGYGATIELQQQKEQEKKKYTQQLKNGTSEDVYDISIHSLGLSTRAENALRQLKWYSVGDIGSLNQLRSTRGVGNKTVEEIVTKLNLIGVELY